MTRITDLRREVTCHDTAIRDLVRQLADAGNADPILRASLVRHEIDRETALRGLRKLGVERNPFSGDLEETITDEHGDLGPSERVAAKGLKR